ncbi:DMT family transporter [Bacillus sp. 1P06AnD]|uniref:DMT family transporter n=1 Tax=Bacillus sp. 1P06AnD TaxID=3132208 RepID=UPI0039A1D188
MNPYLFLAIAIISEVFGSSMLKMADGFKKRWPSVGAICGLLIAFYFLSLSLRSVPLGTAYAIWSGVGTALTALVGIFIYKEKASITKGLGILFIIGGVVLLKLSSSGIH